MNGARRSLEVYENPLAFGIVAFTLLMLAIVPIVVAPVVAYRCARAEVGVTCTIERSAGGLFRRESFEVPRIFGADSATYTSSGSSRRGGRARGHGSETHEVLTLLGRDGAVLAKDDQKSVLGNSAADLEHEIEGLVAARRGGPFLRWQVPILPIAMATIMLATLVGVATEFARRRRGGPPGAPARALIAVAVALAVLAPVWGLALAGCFPAALAALLGAPGG